MSYQVNLKSWIAGSGWQYTTPIDTITEYTSARDYITACNENMDITPWERPDDGEAFYIEVTDADGVPLSDAWTSGDPRADREDYPENHHRYRILEGGSGSCVYEEEET